VVPDLFIGQVGEMLKKVRKMHMMTRIDEAKCFVVVAFRESNLQL
jgi:hypothetical protein